MTICRKYVLGGNVRTKEVKENSVDRWIYEVAVLITMYLNKYKMYTHTYTAYNLILQFTNALQIVLYGDRIIQFSLIRFRLRLY